MNWSILLNGLSELIVIVLLFVLIFYLVYSINLKLLGNAKSTFVVNEAMAIYIVGTFIALAIVFQPMLGALSSNLAVVDTEGMRILQSEFYTTLLPLVAVALVLYLLLLFASVFLFSRLTFSLNEMRDIMNNNRRSAILLSGLLVAIFYACSNLFEVIFSSIFEMPGNEFIF